MEKIADEITQTENISIGILIGGNCSRALEPREVIPSKNGGPYAFQTLLGWCIVGPVGAGGNDASVACNRVAVQDLTSKAIAPHYFPTETEIKDIGIEQMLHKMYLADFIDQSSSVLQESDCEMLVEDRRFMEIMNRECAREGKHKLPLPLKDQDQDFPNNRKMAELRLHNLKKRFKHDKKFHEVYTNFMQDMISKGHAELQDEKKCQQGKVWYIPHHAVFHPSKPVKLRVVLTSVLSGMVFHTTNLLCQVLLLPIRSLGCW